MIAQATAPKAMLSREIEALQSQLETVLQTVRQLRSEVGRYQADVDVEELVGVVAAEFGVTKEAIGGRIRTATIALARQVAMALSVELCGVSANEVGRIFHRDHATVMWAQRATENAVTTDPKIAAKVAAVRRRLNECNKAPQGA